MHDDAHDVNQQMALYACLPYTYIIIRVESAEGAREHGSFNNTHWSRLSRAPLGAVKWRFSREPQRPVRPADGN